MMKKLIRNYGGVALFYVIIFAGILALNYITFSEKSTESFSVAQIDS